ncbi:MAG: MarC family protein [Myxococcaceae bacterium]
MKLPEFFELFLYSLSAIFFVVDVFGVVPLFIAMTANDSRTKSRSMAARACVTGAALLIFFALFGGFVFKVMGVTLSAFRVAGGILLLITALDMLKARQSETRTSAEETKEGTQKEDIAIVPLAMPLLAGPGSIATVMVLMSRGPNAFVVAIPVVISIVITFGISYAILRGAALVQRVLGSSGLAVLERVMGLLLGAIAVQFIADGGRDLLLKA